MPLNADCDTESVSIFNALRVKIIVICPSKPTVFSENIVIVYNVFSILKPPESPRKEISRKEGRTGIIFKFNKTVSENKCLTSYFKDFKTTTLTLQG
jgi:hypothetical protein